MTSIKLKSSDLLKLALKSLEEGPHRFACNAIDASERAIKARYLDKNPKALVTGSNALVIFQKLKPARIFKKAGMPNERDWWWDMHDPARIVAIQSAIAIALVNGD